MAKLKKIDDMQPMHSKYMKYIGISAIVLGLLVLLNQYYSIMAWAYFIGIILIIIGLKKLLLKHRCC